MSSATDSPRTDPQSSLEEMREHPLPLQVRTLPSNQSGSPFPRRMMRDRSMSIVIDKKSPDPKSRQISKLIKQFTAGSIPHYKKLVSTDQFKDMI